MVVEVDGVRTSPRSLFSGVPQGCIPSPLFFSMFINGLCSSIRFAKFHFYADDLQIYLSGDNKDLSGIISALNDDLASISRWAAGKGLSLNPCKFQANLISNSNVDLVMPHLFLGTKKIPWCDVVTDLGVVIDGRLTFCRQFMKVCSKIYATLYTLRLLKLLTPKKVRLRLCKALLLLYFFL
jgi:hypothetical protein